MSNLKSGIRQWLVCGTCDGVLRRNVVAGLSRATPHSLVLDADLESFDGTLARGGSRIDTVVFSGGNVLEIDRHRCSGCGRCVGSCPEEALKIEQRKLSLDPERCVGCGSCVDACPRGALRVYSRPLANFHVSTSEHGRVVHADLLPGVPNSPELVDGLRDRAFEEARRFGVDLVITDVPCVFDATKCLFFSEAAGVLAVMGHGQQELSRMRGMIERVRGTGIPLLVLCLGTSDQSIASIPGIEIVERSLDMDALSVVVRAGRIPSNVGTSGRIPVLRLSGVEVARLQEAKIMATGNGIR